LFASYKLPVLKEDQEREEEKSWVGNPFRPICKWSEVGEIICHVFVPLSL